MSEMKNMAIDWENAKRKAARGSDKPTQEDQILDLLKERPEGITPGDALNEVGCFRLAARISDLKKKGYRIKSERYTTPRGAHVARYVLE